MTRELKQDRSKRRLLLRVLGIAFAGTAVLFLLLVGLVGVVGWRVVECIRINVDDADVQKAVRYAVVHTLEEGEREQKLQMIDELAKLGPDATMFVADLLAAANGDDPQVRDAAIDAVRVIDPAALDRLENREKM
jgi:predicted negative regulator of RcsB-dependent stress response